MPHSEHTLPQQLRNRDRERLRRYTDMLRFYNGDQWPLPAPRRQRRLTFNYVRAILHKATAYLMNGRTVTVQPDDTSDAAIQRAGEAETAILQVLEQNNADALDFDTELDAAVLGDGVYKVFWDTDEQRIRITSPDPAGVFAWHWPDDPSRVWRVANRYQLDGDAAQQTLGYLATPFSKNNTIVEAWTRDTFDVWVGDTLASSTTNPYGFIPFVVFPNVREPKQIWGASDVPPLIDVQRELNRALTQLALIMELSGNPVAVLENVTDSQDIAVVPGAVWNLPADAKAYLLDLLKGGGIRLHIDFLDALYRALHDLGETPRSAFGDSNANISGVALELELDPIVKKVARKRLIRTDAYRQRHQMVLALLDLFTGTDFGHANHTIAWGNVLPTDRDRLVNNEALLVGAGVHSRRHAADALGGVDDPDSEFARWLDEQRDINQGERSQDNA